MDLPDLGFGGAPLGGLLDPVGDAAAANTVQAALDAGLKYFDTAPYYGFGLSERRFSCALAFASSFLCLKCSFLTVVAVISASFLSVSTLFFHARHKGGAGFCRLLLLGT